MERFQELLFRNFYAFAMSVAIRYSYNQEDAREIINDSFLKVFNNINTFDDDKPFKSWFRRIIVNTSLDHYRANKKFRLQTSYDDEELSLEIPEGDDELNNYGVDDILEIFNRMPDLYRMIFNLYEVEGYNHDEIGGMLSIAPGTSRSHLSRAKKMIRKIYTDQRKNQRNEAV